MSVTLSKEKDDFVVINIHGVLTFDDLQTIQNEYRDKISQGKKISVLILAQAFTGWGKEGDWGDLTFLYESDPFIKKMAIVAEEKWKDEMLMFTGAGRRQAAVEFFSSDQVQEARNWLLGL